MLVLVNMLTLSQFLQNFYNTSSIFVPFWPKIVWFILFCKHNCKVWTIFFWSPSFPLFAFTGLSNKCWGTIKIYKLFLFLQIDQCMRSACNFSSFFCLGKRFRYLFFKWSDFLWIACHWKRNLFQPWYWWTPSFRTDPHLSLSGVNNLFSFWRSDFEKTQTFL